MHPPARLLTLAALLASLAGCDAASASSDTAAAATPTPADTARENRLARADIGRIAGAESAPIWLVVISDFQCPFCKRWHEETGPRIEREYVRTGKVRIAYLNLPISTHRNAPPAHEAAMCAAEQERFWPVADAIFATQDTWKSRRDAAAFFDSLSVPLVSDAARFRRCIADGGTRALIDADVNRVTRLGVGSTPTFLVGPQVIVGAQPYEVFRGVLDAALAAAPQR
jgi:protein-disulfide isomerase